MGGGVPGVGVCAWVGAGEAAVKTGVVTGEVGRFTEVGALITAAGEIAAEVGGKVGIKVSGKIVGRVWVLRARTDVVSTTGELTAAVVAAGVEVVVITGDSVKLGSTASVGSAALVGG